jgi:phage-related minor tail protein
MTDHQVALLGLQGVGDELINSSIVLGNAILTSILSGQGGTTIPIFSTCCDCNAKLAVVMNGLGTLATHEDVVALNSSVLTGNSIQTAILDGQATMNSALSSMNSLLTALLNGQGTIIAELAKPGGHP